MIHCLGLSPALDVTYGVPALTVGGIHRPTLALKLAGGKALNAARALATLGRDVRAIVPLGGRTGDLVADLLVPTGVALERVPTTTETRMCVTVTDDVELTEFYENAAPLEADAWRGIRSAVDAINEGWLLVSGSVPVGVPVDELVQMLTGATGRGLRVVVDVHGEALDAIVRAGAASIVKVNRAEAAAVAGAEARALAAGDLADALAQFGVPIVVVTDGVDGSVARDDDGCRWRARSDAAPGAYAVGSGDSFLAGLVDALEAGETLGAALGRASATATANARRPGAALFTEADAEDASRSITVTAE